MAGKIQTMIPQYGELNRIYRDYIDNYAFSFDRQKFISDFYQEYNDMKSFEAAILELVLDKQKEQYTLILNRPDEKKLHARITYNGKVFSGN